MDMARILVVEDDKDIAHLVASRDEGFEVDVVHDGADGPDAALMGGYDLIVFDLMLPL